LEGIFSPRMDGAFRNTLAVEFIGRCVLTWKWLSSILDRLASASLWSEADSTYWQAMPSSSDQMERARFMTKNVLSFLADTGETVRSNMDHYWGLCSAILLDCDDHAAFTRVVAALKFASIELHSIAFDYRTRAKVAELEASDEVVASRVRRYNSVVAQFQGQCLFWTKQGFHGLSSPGVGGCGHAVVLLDGLSFPMVVRDDDKQLVGCAIIREVNMQGIDGRRAKLLADFNLGEKTVFKFA